MQLDYINQTLDALDDLVRDNLLGSVYVKDGPKYNHLTNQIDLKVVLCAENGIGMRSPCVTKILCIYLSDPRFFDELETFCVACVKEYQNLLKIYG